MTGQEILQYALQQANTNQNAIDSDSEAYTSWALTTVNFVTRDLYYFIQSRLPSEERETVTRTQDFTPEGSDLLLLAVNEKILRVYVKYRENYDYVMAEKISLNSFRHSPDWLQANATEAQPLYTALDRNLMIFPKPKEVVPNGILVHKIRQYNELTALSDDILGIPSDFEQVIIPALMAKIYERLRRYDDSNALRERFLLERSEMLKEVSRRVGQRSRTVYRQPIFT